VLSVDLTIPIAVLGVAAGIVLAARAYAAWAERAIATRTDALLVRFGLDASTRSPGAEEPAPHHDLDPRA
jgi:hypothetical protein